MDTPTEAPAPDEKDTAAGSSKPAGQISRPQLFTWGLGKSGQLGTGKDTFLLPMQTGSALS